MTFTIPGVILPGSIFVVRIFVGGGEIMVMGGETGIGVRSPWTFQLFLIISLVTFPAPRYMFSTDHSRRQVKEDASRPYLRIDRRH